MSINITTLHDNVAIEVIKFNHTDIAKNAKAGFALTDKLMKTLVESTVVFNSKTFKAGQKVFFRSEIASLPQLRQVMFLDDKEFVLIPESLIVAVQE